MMRESPLFVAIARYLFFVINIFVLYLLLRGHNLPGGGFIAGAGTAISFVMLVLALGTRAAEALLPVRPLTMAGLGLLLAAGVGSFPMLFGEGYLKHYHPKFDSGTGLGQIYLGTPVWFDLGVYAIVVGVLLKLIVVLARAKEGYSLVSSVERPSCALSEAEDLEGRRGEEAGNA